MPGDTLTTSPQSSAGCPAGTTGAPAADGLPSGADTSEDRSLPRSCGRLGAGALETAPVKIAAGS